MSQRGEMPAKRRPGRPRKTRGHNAKLRGKTPPQIPTTASQGQTFHAPQLASTSGKGKEHVDVDAQNDQNEQMVGQAVTGVIEGAFDAGYLIKVKVQDTDSLLRGVVFNQAKIVQVTPANDIAPGVKMHIRKELPIPVLTPEVAGAGASSSKPIQETVKSVQLDSVENEAVEVTEQLKHGADKKAKEGSKECEASSSAKGPSLDTTLEKGDCERGLVSVDNQWADDFTNQKEENKQEPVSQSSILIDQCNEIVQELNAPNQGDKGSFERVEGEMMGFGLKLGVTEEFDHGLKEVEDHTAMKNGGSDSAEALEPPTKRQMTDQSEAGNDTRDSSKSQIEANPIESAILQDINQVTFTNAQLLGTDNADNNIHKEDSNAPTEANPIDNITLRGEVNPCQAESTSIAIESGSSTIKDSKIPTRSRVEIAMESVMKETTPEAGMGVKPMDC